MARRPSPRDEPFVGRASERAVLRAALATAAAGHGRIVLLAGEPGIGKTRLAEAFAGWAREAGAEVLAGRCFEGSGAPAFWPWTQVLRAYASTRDAENLVAELGSDGAEIAAMIPDLRERLPALGAVPADEGDQARFRFFDAVTRVFLRSAARRPLVIVLGELHGADASSLRLLQFLTRELRAARVVVVATLRDVALVPGHPLAETLGELVREQVSEVLELRGLEQDEVAELMTHMRGTAPPAELAARVHARTEGNPLYVVEVVRALARGGVDAAGGETLAIPATVRMAIGRHLGALSAAAHTTLTQAALFGREFDTDAVARAGEWPIDAVLARVDEAVTGRIVAALPGRPGRYRFAHALFFETLVEAQGEARRVALHRSAAQALAADPRGGDAAEIAQHWVAAGPAGEPAEAVAWAQRAGDEALRVLAYEKAAQWYRDGLTALGWTGTDQPARHAELLLGLGEALKRTGATTEAGAARSLLAWVERQAGRVDEARRIVDRIASRVLAAVRTNIHGVVAATLLSQSCAVVEDAGHAAPLYEALVPYAPYWVHWALAVSLGPATHALGLLASTLGRQDEAAAHFEHAIAETRRVGARPFLARSLHEYAVLLRRHRGDASQAAALLAESRAIAEEIGMAGLLRNIAVLDEAGPRSAATSPPEEGVFHREGDYWTIGYAERTVQIRDGRGLQYLARLLHQPGQEMPATFLTAGDRGNVRHVAHDGETIAARDLGDAGPVLDARAAAEYRRRAEELRAELAEAEACNDLGHAARARREIDLLCGELTALHRDRRAASHAERARLTVTKGIKAALAKLAEVHPALSDHLMATVKRGYLCVYRPDPRRPIHWRE